MIVGEFRHGQLAIIDRLKETVRLSEGLKDKGRLTDAARRRALDCLSRFGERLRDMRASNVRTAGTSALRRAADSGDFREEAERALGHPIEVISGIEEARLIYNGVFHSMPQADGFRLVLDIGGGSTELILGQGNKPHALESLHMGCVNMTEEFFADGRLNKRNFEEARMAARLKLRPVKAFFRDAMDIDAVGCSGTILSTENVARQVGAIESNDLTSYAVEELIERAMRFNVIDELSIRGLSSRRAEVWPGGLAILVELMEVLRIGTLRVSDGALREGLLYDHIGRLHHEDARERSVKAMARRYNIDKAQASRVAKTAQQLLEQVAGSWKLDAPLAGQSLRWAATLHEIGLDIAHIDFQQHGAYITANADLPGFPRSEQKLLAFLVATQRSDLNRSSLGAVTSKWKKPALRLSILLRLAVLLNRSRSNTELPEIVASAKKSRIELDFPDAWLDANPLTIMDLEREQQFLSAIGYELKFT
jgi:exopolyphosphatase/guanosine-5'-triphosphate,3'-diphosphate pyrophosphatase